MGHNSADYLHSVIEALKLAYADRDTYYADQDFVDVPANGLLSKDYARQRAAEIDMAPRPRRTNAGDPLPFDPRSIHGSTGQPVEATMGCSFWPRLSRIPDR